MQFDQSSEKLDAEIEQFELRLEDLEEGEGARRSAAQSSEEANRPREGRRQPVRRPLPAHLPREEIVHTPGDACPGCGGRHFSKLGEDVSEVLEKIPARLKVLRHVRPRRWLHTGQAETAIELLADSARAQPWGPFIIDNGYVWHPRGARLDYIGVYREGSNWQLRNTAGTTLLNQFGEPVRLYGGLVTENIVQRIARTNMAENIEQMAEGGALDRWPLVLNTHDELVPLVIRKRSGRRLRTGAFEIIRRINSACPICSHSSAP
jgi:hypothetical protein